jgi:hypothetical protein
MTNARALEEMIGRLNDELKKYAERHIKDRAIVDAAIRWYRHSTSKESKKFYLEIDSLLALFNTCRQYDSENGADLSPQRSDGNGGDNRPR